MKPRANTPGGFLQEETPKSWRSPPPSVSRGCFLRVYDVYTLAPQRSTTIIGRLRPGLISLRCILRDLRTNKHQ